MCDLSVTREEMLAAVQHIVDSRGRTRTTSTTPVPTTVAYQPEVDDCGGGGSFDYESPFKYILRGTDSNSSQQ